MKLSVVDQVQEALKPKNRTAAYLGALLGGFVPAATFAVAHFEAARNPLLWVLVGGGLAYSATTVYTWGRRAFASAIKSLGFVLMLEGIMVFATSPVLGYAALAVLATINAIATGAQLALDRREAKAAARVSKKTRAAGR